MTGLIDHEVTRIDGTKANLADYRGKTLLIVNVASRCGYTRQYAGLERLNETYKARGLAVLGFPANEFGGQEPGTNEEIASFCSSRFGVSFDMFEKVVVKGDGMVPLYRTLTTEGPEATRGDIRWNFTKFLVGPDGRVVQRFEPAVEPESAELIAAIEANLPKP
jgi:glutathione peroxidase